MPAGRRPTGIPYDQFEQVSGSHLAKFGVDLHPDGARGRRIASVLRAVGLPVRRTTWRIRPNGARSEVVEHVAACMGLGIEGQDDNTLRCQGPFPVGSAPAPGAEVAAVRSRLLRAVLRLRIGRFWLRMGPRPQSSIAYWNVDRDGGLISIQQYPAGTFGGRGWWSFGPTAMGDPIPADRLVVYSHDMDRGCGLATACCDPRTSAAARDG